MKKILFSMLVCFCGMAVVTDSQVRDVNEVSIMCCDNGNGLTDQKADIREILNF